MAEAAVSTVLGRLVDVYNYFDDLHCNLPDQVKLLQQELEAIRSLLRDADAKHNQNERLCEWLHQIRKAAYDAEDLIDEYILRISSMEAKNIVSRIPYYCYAKWKLSSDIADRLNSVNRSLKRIYDRQQDHGIEKIGDDGATYISEALWQKRKSPSNKERHGQDRDVFVGLDVPKARLVEQLVHGDCWCALAIVGMAGVGKTTLAEEVYKDPAIKSHFPSGCAWIFVSQKFSARDVLLSMLRQIAPPRERLEGLLEEQLENLLCKYLRRKRYVVILDDVWSSTHWDCLRRAFPKNNNGSRLLLTTRNKKVAQVVVADPQIEPYQLEGLSDEDSWRLFCNKACVEVNDPQLSPLMRKIGMDVLKRCAGLPLAIVLTGGLLSGNRNQDEWERILRSMDSIFHGRENPVWEILALSYNDLPYYLKPCFLYLGLFPEGQPIPKHKLFRLWIAEGLIRQYDSRSMEEIAEDYLIELIERNMVQVARKSVNGKVRDCLLHDLIRDLAILKAMEQDFLQIPGNHERPPASRRHPIYCKSHLPFLEQDPKPPLRSLLFFKVVAQSPYGILSGRNPVEVTGLLGGNLDIVSRRFKLLRILDLEGVSCGIIPETIGKVILLKYLGLRQTNITRLPKQLTSLHQLQTLDIAKNTDIKNCPDVIGKMKKLMHLYMDGNLHFDGYLIIDTLEHLDTLKEIHVEQWKKNNTAKLVCLRKLRIRGDFSSDTNAIFGKIVVLPQLRSLGLHSDGADFPPFDQLSSLTSLRKLHLRGMITQLPQAFPPHLTQITLEETGLRQTSIQILAGLPLSTLILKRGSYSEATLEISRGGFRYLESLELNSLASLLNVNVEEGAMPGLKKLRVANCSSWRMLPGEMRFMTTLDELYIEEMPQDSINNLQQVDLQSVKIHIH